ncbi:hypothetical protein LX36DRAFT_162357 [Colletotrichum falcatum]|nr:hypothetical protein LX36DRAFT_162357 [Colletotrichum falcatum]
MRGDWGGGKHTYSQITYRDDFVVAPTHPPTYLPRYLGRVVGNMITRDASVVTCCIAASVHYLTHVQLRTRIVGLIVSLLVSFLSFHVSFIPLVQHLRHPSRVFCSTIRSICLIMVDVTRWPVVGS